MYRKIGVEKGFFAKKKYSIEQKFYLKICTTMKIKLIS